MHVGGVLPSYDAPPSYDALATTIGGRLHRLPRYRQRLAWPPGGLLRPCWVDDPRFDLAYHVRHAALPHPHGEAELSALAGRLFAQPLDRTRPLWEVHLVDGVEGGRFALVAKIHHALADGVSGVDRISSVHAPLPVGIADPGERLVAVMAGMAETKGSGQSAGAEAVAAAGDLAPPQVMGLVARQMASPRLFNLTGTTIPGPPVALYLLGRRLTDVFPLVPLVREHGLGIAVMSYDGALDFGLLACADTVPDLRDLAGDLAASLTELPGWTRARRFDRPAPSGAPSPTLVR